MAARWSPPTAARLAVTVMEASVCWVLTPSSTTSLLLLTAQVDPARPLPATDESPLLPPVPVHAPPVSAVPQPAAPRCG